MPETIEHRVIRSKSRAPKRLLIEELDNNSPALLEDAALVPEHIHFPQSIRLIRSETTSLPKFVNCFMPKVICPLRHY